jgi:hypothetical protein
MVHLAWCRVHNGEFKQPRRSSEGVRVDDPATAVLDVVGRAADSLVFEVTGGILPDGFDPTPPIGFRYDLATDSAMPLPFVVPPPPFASGFPGGLPAYPYFAYHEPGAPVFPPSLFAPAVAVAAALRVHCRFEPALKWYELVFNPLLADASWLVCEEDYDDGDGNDDDNGDDDGDDDDVDFVAGGPLHEARFAILRRLRRFAGIDGEAPIEDEDDEDVSRPGDRDGSGMAGWESLCCEPADLTEDDFRRRSIVLHYLETLLQWGDALLRRNTPEAFQQARLIFETAARILGLRPRTALGDDDPGPPTDVDGFAPHAAALNPRLLALYDVSEDRLDLIHACLNARRLRHGRPNVDMPYFGHPDSRAGWGKTVQPCLDDGWSAEQVCLDDADWCCPPSPYRFLSLVARAKDLAGEVRNLGTALLSAYERGDAEYLASLRATQERQILELTREVRQHQWREADWQVQALGKTMEIAQTRRRYNATLLATGLITGELQHESLIGVALSFQHASRAAELVSQAVSWVPDIEVGSVGPFPTVLNRLPLGTKLGGIFASVARVSDSLAGSASLTAGLRLTQAGWVRREDEWRHQVEVLDIEIAQIERQILAAERQRDAALRELNTHQRQIEHAVEVQDFLRDKFTSHELFLWLQQETAALHQQMYELALHTARQSQRALNYECGHTARVFVSPDDWDSLREGLLAGDRLQLAVNQMEKSYLDQHHREYELTKHISLRLHFPLAYLALLATGSCEIELPEWMFDLDYPGHFLRRIKNVSLTIPAVVGPYVGVHCRLTLLGSTTRVQPYLIDPPAPCCPPDEPPNGYHALPDDPRIVRQYAATEAIATSSGQNDSGMFELLFRDERYLPFEFAGAVSRWRIELPPENNQFDLETLSDVVLHLNFTAREGGETLRAVANDLAQHHLPGSGLRFFDVRHDMPDAWQRLTRPPDGEPAPRDLALRLGRNMFAFLPAGRELWINHLELFFEAPGATPNAHRLLKLLIWRAGADPRARRPQDYRLVRFRCVASAEWPDLYHGVADREDLGEAIGPLGYVADRELVTWEFPPDIGEISRAYVVCGYETR